MESEKQSYVDDLRRVVLTEHWSLQPCDTAARVPLLHACSLGLLYERMERSLWDSR